MKTCKVHNCNNEIEAKGFCQKHYKRYKNGQDPFIDSKKDPNDFYIKENTIVVKTRAAKARDVIVDIEKEDAIVEILSSTVITGNKSYPQITVYRDDEKTSEMLVYKIFGNLEEGFVYSYKDSNGYNLTKENVEVISTIEHSRRLAVKNAKYKVPGLSYRKREKAWVATISVDGKSIYLGCFDTEDEAAQVRIAAEEKYWGKVYSNLN